MRRTPLRTARLALLLTVVAWTASCRTWQPMNELGPFSPRADRVRVTTGGGVFESDLYDLRGDTLVVFSPMSAASSGELVRATLPDISRLEQRLPDYTRTAVLVVGVGLGVLLTLTDIVTGPDGS